MTDNQSIDSDTSKEEEKSEFPKTKAAGIEKTKTEVPKPPVLKNVQRRASAFSLKSVHQKKATVKKVKEEDFNSYPKEVFTQEELGNAWKNHQKKLQKKGEKSMASIMAADEPKLREDFIIEFTLPNKLMEDQLKQGLPKLLKHLRASLNNYAIKLEVTVNEAIEKKFAYTPLEKYNKLKEKNPLIEKLKDTFHLDL